MTEGDSDEMGDMLWIWIGFITFVVFLLVLDLGVFHRKDHIIGWKEALAWSGFWVALALAFNVLVYFAYEYQWFGLEVAGAPPGGRAAAVLFFTGYVVEKSLSLDNLFVIALIFAYFRIPGIYQHRVLFWGILGALIMRAVMILAGAALIDRFEWILYVFGVFLIFTAGKMLLSSHDPDPVNNRVVRLVRRWFPVADDYHGHHFFTVQNGKRHITHLGLALVVVETSDLMFAVDSIPAIFAITRDPFIVFTSNVFAILGLRSLYFALASIMDKFHYLKVSLALLLGLVGVKMLLADWLHTIPGITYWTLGAIAVILAGGVVASLIHARRVPTKDLKPDQIPVR